MMDLLVNFRADLQVGIDQLVERVGHHAFGRVLDRHHAESGPALSYILKNFGDARGGLQVDRGTEFLPSGEMGIGRLGAKERYLERSLEGAAAGNDLSENGSNGRFGKRSAF